MVLFWLFFFFFRWENWIIQIYFYFSLALSGPSMYIKENKNPLRKANVLKSKRKVFLIDFRVLWCFAVFMGKLKVCCSNRVHWFFVLRCGFFCRQIACPKTLTYLLSFEETLKIPRHMQESRGWLLSEIKSDQVVLGHENQVMMTNNFKFGTWNCLTSTENLFDSGFWWQHQWNQKRELWVIKSFHEKSVKLSSKRPSRCATKPTQIITGKQTFYFCSSRNNRKQKNFHFRLF